MNYKSLLLFLLAFVFNSCLTDGKDKENLEWKDYSENIIRSHINKKIIFPDSVAYSSCDKIQMDSILSLPAKIIFNVDVDCITCLNKFLFWSKFGEEIRLKSGRTIPILAFVNGSSQNNIIKTVDSLWGNVWLYDNDYSWIDMNGLNDDRFQAVLLDRDNIIRIIGNPMLNEKLGDLYKQTVCRLLNE